MLYATQSRTPCSTVPLRSAGAPCAGSVLRQCHQRGGRGSRQAHIQRAGFDRCCIRGVGVTAHVCTDHSCQLAIARHVYHAPRVSHIGPAVLQSCNFSSSLVAADTHLYLKCSLMLQQCWSDFEDLLLVTHSWRRGLCALLAHPVERELDQPREVRHHAQRGRRLAEQRVLHYHKVGARLHLPCASHPRSWHSRGVSDSLPCKMLQGELKMSHRIAADTCFSAWLCRAAAQDAWFCRKCCSNAASVGVLLPRDGSASGCASAWQSSERAVSTTAS